MMHDTKLQAMGHIEVYDDLGNCVLDEHNEIHFENMCLNIANSLGRKPAGGIEYMVFGNGGSTVTGIGTVTYLAPNTVGANATLYNQTYQKLVDNLNVSNTDPTRNRIDISHVNGNLFSDIIIQCFLDYGEPSGQNAFDNTTNVESTYVFDELGLVGYENHLLTHAIFSPVEKSSNRAFNIKYTLRIQCV